MKFAWGQVVDKFTYDFDGVTMEVTKYIPNGNTVIHFHSEDLHESTTSLMHLIVAWIAWRNLGLNQGSLVRGICKALETT